MYGLFLIAHVTQLEARPHNTTENPHNFAIDSLPSVAFLGSNFLSVCRSVVASAASNILSTVTLTSLTLQHLYAWAGARCYSHTGDGGDGLQACQVCTTKQNCLCNSSARTWHGKASHRSRLDDTSCVFCPTSLPCGIIFGGFMCYA